MVDRKHDVVIVTGGDSGMNGASSRRGQVVRRHARPHAVVDAPDTAGAQAKKILAQNGLKDGTDYGQTGRRRRLSLPRWSSKTMLPPSSTPFTVQAEQSA